VLTVDPSSTISGGSILGDKTRMETLARRPEAFIRPSPSGTTLGGVTRRSRETLLLCEAAGFDVIIVETVGVGQSETRVADMTDMFVLLLQPGAGDQLQGIKRGIMELADLILINQADDGRESLAENSAREYRHALHLLRPRSHNWTVEVATCSARDGQGIDAAWDAVQRRQAALDDSGELASMRAAQARTWLWTEVQESLLADLREQLGSEDLIAELEDAVADGRLPATTAADQLLDYYLKKNRHE
jgi:LAO/AO transport system kinase